MSLFNELKRRNVFRVGIAYLVIGWLLLQVTDVVAPILELPDWVAKLVLFLLLIGLPLVLFFAWAFELTPEGIKREHEVERDKSVTGQTGRTLDRVIIAVLVVALAWFAWDRFGTAPPTGEPVVAVLPFLATGSEDGGVLAAGLHDDLLTKLQKLGAFQVISRTSVMEYADRSKNMRQIGRELGASYILEGSVQALGDRVRINAQMIVAEDDDHVWAETYDHELTAANLFDVQAELANAIASSMHTTLSPEDQAIVRDVPTQNMDAYNAYLRGLRIWESTTGVGGPEDREAIAAFEEAVSLDPDFALAWAWLAAAHIRSAGNAYNQETSAAALAAWARARELQQDLLEVELIWAEYLYRQRSQYARAFETLESLGSRISGNTYALSLKAYLLRRLGRNAQAYQVLEEVRRLEPRSSRTYFNLIVYAILLEDCKAAGQHASTLLSLAPDSHLARGGVAHYELQCNGDAERAAALTGEDWITNGDIPVSLLASFAARDGKLAERVIASMGEVSGPAWLVWQQVNYYDLYTRISPDADMAQQSLKRASEMMEAYRSEQVAEDSAGFALTSCAYFAAHGQSDETIHWCEEHRRLIETVNTDVSMIPLERFWRAYYYAMVGLQDEAVEALGELLSNPENYRFPLIELLPVFDEIRDHPGYIKLKREYGK